eukprot:TRINITY_DN2201_c4_g1_i7.p1 TRINITY_DN2201_c4_g1~~TRINITY_DN2201_c4_g1_i7.p1  ORF type:complete len:1178 (+),score=201.43 TRINITY_DN2201_c4_g1_i7:252-3785(+)
MQAHTIQIFMISILGLVLLQLSYAQTISMDNPGCPCTNKEPPGEFSCDQQKQYKKCTAEWMISGDFCAITCGRCVCVQEEDLADRQVGEDLPAELLANGDTETSEGGDDKVCECTDVPPPNPWEYTCEQQKDFGKCTESFMIDKNFCQITCGRCPCTPEELEEAMLSNSTEVLQATEDISALSAFVVGGTPSATPVSTSDSPMDNPVQDTEDQLLEIMDMLQHSTLLLDDNKKQGKGRRKGGKGNQKEEKAPATEEQEEGAYTLPLQNQVLDLPAIIAGSDAASPPLQEVEQVQPFALPEYDTPIMSPMTESVYTQDVQEPYLYEPELVSQSSLVAPPPPPQMTYITPITVDDGMDAGYYNLGVDVTQSSPLPDVVGDIQQPEPSGQLPVGVAYDTYDLNSDSLPGQIYSSNMEEPVPEGVTLPPGFNLGSGAQPMLLPPDEVVDVYSQDVTNPSSSTYKENDSDVPQAMATLADEMPFDSQAAMDNYLYGVSIDPAQNVIGEPEQEVSSQGAVAPFELPELVQGSYAGLQQIYQPEPEAEVPTRPLSIDIPLQNPAPEPEAGESAQSAILGPILSMSVPEEPFKELSIEPSQDAEEVAVTPLVLPSPLPSALTLTPTLEELPSLTKPSLVPVPEPEQQSGMQGVASVDSIEIPKQSGLMDMPVISATIDDDEDEDNGVVIMSPVEEAKEKPVKESAGDEQLFSTLGLEGEGEPGSAECFFSALSTVADLSLLMTIIENAGPSFAQLLIPEGETVTFLAPANEAFTSLMFQYDITFEQLMEAQPEILMGLFSYHFVEGDVTIEYMEETGALTSLLGQMVFVETGSSDSISGVKISGYLGEEAEILNAEMRACGIMVHVIDTLLMPDGMESTLLGVLDVPETPAATATAPVPKQQACQNITLLELLSQQENAETMSTALYQLEQSGADLLLTGDVPYTMFVPTNDVFASTLNELIAMNSPLVTSTGSSVEENLLLYHIIQGQKLTLEDLLELPVVSTMYSGAEISLNSANDQLLLQGIGNEARIITSDIGNACNVVVHLINSVLLPQIPNVPAVSIVPQTGYGDQEGQAGLDVQPSDITFDQIVPYLPTGAVSDQQYQKQPATSEVPLESCKTIGEVIESVTDLSIMGLSLIDAGFGELLSDIQLEVSKWPLQTHFSTQVLAGVHVEQQDLIKINQSI